MNIPGGNHLDRRRRLRPCDYATDAHRFGRDPGLRFTVPDGGDAVSSRIAHVQHLLVVRWRADGRCSGAEIARRWSFSRQTWSRTVLGERFAGELVLIALLEAVLPVRPPPGR